MEDDDSRVMVWIEASVHGPKLTLGQTPYSLHDEGVIVTREFYFTFMAMRSQVGRMAGEVRSLIEAAKGGVAL